MYRRIVSVLQRVANPKTLFRYGFNLSPMYSRSTGQVRKVSSDLKRVEVEIPLTWRNRNYVGTMFGGSMLSATDPVLMIQLMQILGKGYVVWDKEVTMRFRRPARKNVKVLFEFSDEEIEGLKKKVELLGETTLVKTLELVDEDGVVVAQAEKTLYVASSEHYKAKRASRQRAN